MLLAHISEATVQIALQPAAMTDRPTLANLMQFYLYDRSEMVPEDVDEQGCFHYPSLDLYWTEAGRYPFLIRAEERLAGFALVDRGGWLNNSIDGHMIAEFFILRMYRRSGIGRAAAAQLFDRFPGPWEIASPATNVPAQAFWRSTLQGYTGGTYREIWVQTVAWRGPVQSFFSPPSRL
jgi:predicted acetyltransferase